MALARLTLVLVIFWLPISLLGAEPDSPRALAQRLSWKSVGGTCMGTVLWVRAEGEAAEKLIALGARSDSALVEALTDPQRGVAAHLVLSHIHDSDKLLLLNGYFGQSISYEWSGGDLKGWTHTFNELSWRWESGGRESVEQAALNANADRWRKRLGLNVLAVSEPRVRTIRAGFIARRRAIYR